VGALRVSRYKYNYAMDNKNISIIAYNGVAIAYT
jgi:hypothetical protein